jgi:hypothetical protein
MESGPSSIVDGPWSVVHRPSSIVHGPESSGLPGREIETPFGCCLLYEERYALDHRHGGTELSDCLELPPRAAACLARWGRLEPLDLRQAVFLDTETTGLAGGTGTTAFLVGIGYFATKNAQPCLKIRQFFMRDFAEERAMLFALREALEPFRYVVTFNGKSFDLPLLETRYVLARLPRPRAPELHLDLLHAARRLWREQLESCSLGFLEEAILGHRRDLDVPSWAIPGLYSAYLRYGEAGPLRRVFSHNRHDLLSLLALAGQIARRLADPLAASLGGFELLAIARLYEQIGLREEACACLEVALERSEQPLRGRVQLLLALYCKRAGRRERSFELWREITLRPPPPSLGEGQGWGPSAALISLIELAKHHEHQRRDPYAALGAVERALALVELGEAYDGGGDRHVERVDLERRLARLLHKVGSR